MDHKTLESLLNPIRMRIFQTIMNQGQTTTKEIREALPDVPPASLYRHIKAMLTHELIEVIEEHKIRGTYEKVYRLSQKPQASLDEVVKAKDPKVLFSLYYTFMITGLLDFQHYLNQETFDLQEDLVGFRSFALYLTDEESLEIMSTLKEKLAHFEHNDPQGRKLRKLSYTLLPILKED